MSDINTRFEQAVQHRLNGEYDAAIPILHTIVAAQPNHASAHHELGLIHTFRVDMDESLLHLETAVKLVPTETKFLLDLGKAHAMYGDFPKAAEAFGGVLQIDPFNQEASKQMDYLRPYL